jgi:hypothetical protein
MKLMIRGAYARGWDIKIKMHRELRLVILHFQNLKENTSWESTCISS